MSKSSLLEQVKTDSVSLWQDKLYFVPIRHHSPACAFALKKLIEEIKPDALLIEGPSDCQHLISLCQDEETNPPVAFLTQKGKAEDLYSAFFPLCEYSPEWVAIRAARDHATSVRLIDLPYYNRDVQERDEKVQTLMEETYLAHSQYLQAIADHQGCRDHHESWDRLFEQRSRAELANWRDFFQDTYAYCSLARQDYHAEVIKAAGDQEREHYMAAQIKEVISDKDATCVVVTGGFHTSALIDLIRSKLELTVKKQTVEDDRNWLIRYSFDQLDSLNGYAAGMPAPGYYQSVWQSLKQGNDDFLNASASAKLVEIAHDNRRQKLTSFISSSEIQAAIFQAKQISRLRNCDGPGRADVMDAVTSCYVKDSVHRQISLLADARRIMCGDQLGTIPLQSRQPPLVSETWQRGLKLGLDFGRTSVKDLELEIYKKPKHRLLSRFFHLLQFCEIGLAQRQSGPNFIEGIHTGLTRESWRYAWTPQVESELLDKITEGATLEAIALNKINNQEKELADSGFERRAKAAAAFLIQACVMGMHDYVIHIAGYLSRLINEDQHIASLTGCGLHLITLRDGKTVLESDKLGLAITPLIQDCWRNTLYLFPYLEEVREEDVDGAINVMLELYTFSREVEASQQDLNPQLESLINNENAAGAIRGAALGIAFQAGYFSQQDMKKTLSLFLQNGQDEVLLLGVLYGLVYTVREVLWSVPEVLSHINGIVDSWSEQSFLRKLPSLRRLFTQLSPNEIDKVATHIVNINYLSTTPANIHKNSQVFSDYELALMPTLDSFARSCEEKLGFELAGSCDEGN